MLQPVRELANKYGVHSGLCSPDGALVFSLSPGGEEIEIGIPKYIARLYDDTVSKWDKDVDLAIFQNKALKLHKWGLWEHVYSAQHKLYFTVKYKFSEQWSPTRNNFLPPGSQGELTEKVGVFLEGTFKKRLEPELAFIPHYDKNMCNVVVTNCAITRADVHTMLEFEEVLEAFRDIGIHMDHMEPVYREGKPPFLRIPVPESKCGSRVKQLKLIGGLHSTLVTPVFRKPVTKPLEFSSRFLATIKEIKQRAKEERLREEQERQDEANRHRDGNRPDKNHVPGIDMKSDELMDEDALLHMFQDPDDYEYVNYINRFLVHVRAGKPYYMVKRVNSLTGQVYMMTVACSGDLKNMFSGLLKKVKVEGDDGKCRVKKVNIISSWLEHRGHLQVHEAVLLPDKPTLVVDELRDDTNKPQVYLNTWIDFAYKIYLKRYTEQQLHVTGPEPGKSLVSYMKRVCATPLPQRQYLEVILEHIYRVYCSGSAVMFWAFCAFFYNILEKPHERMGATMVVVGDFGVGKSLLIQCIGEFALGSGTLYHYFGGDGKRLTSRFNGYFNTGILAFIDEAENCDPSQSGILKSQITEETKQSEVKFGAVNLVRNYMNFIYCGNSFAEVILPGDRRHWCMECDPQAKTKMTHAVRDKLAEACGKKRGVGPLGILQFVMWLKRNKRIFERFDFRVQPYMTPFKRNHMMKHMDDVYKWWKDILRAEVQPKKLTSSRSEYYNPPGEGDDERAKWTGQTTWAILWGDYKRNYGGRGSSRKQQLSQTDFESLLVKCVVIRQEAIKVGQAPIPHADRPLFFGCIAACWAQFDVFLTMGSVHATFQNLDGAQYYENPDWIKRLFVTRYKDDKQRGVGEGQGAFHDRCELCGRCSGSWQKLQEQGVEHLRVEALQTIKEEEEGIMPTVFYRQEGGEGVQHPQPKVCHGEGQRTSYDGSSEEDGSDASAWDELRFAVDRTDDAVSLPASVSSSSELCGRVREFINLDEDSDGSGW